MCPVVVGSLPPPFLRLGSYTVDAVIGKRNTRYTLREELSDVVLKTLGKKFRRFKTPLQLFHPVGIELISGTLLKSLVFQVNVEVTTQ